jgi:hypothetical protein
LTCIAIFQAGLLGIELAVHHGNASGIKHTAMAGMPTAHSDGPPRHRKRDQQARTPITRYDTAAMHEKRTKTSRQLSVTVWRNRLNTAN